MRSLQRILLATDLRPAGEAAAAAAAALAPTFEARVTVLHVLETAPEWPAAPQEHRARAETALRDFTGRLAARGVEVEPLLAEGSPADTTVRTANEIDADLILIGAGELGRGERFAVGPVAASVIEHAPQPVLAVRPGEPAPRFKKILCPVDQSGVSGRGLRNAIRLARSLGGELRILTVIPEVSWLTAAMETGQLAGARSEYESKWREEFERFLADIPTHDVQAIKEVRYGVPHQQIVAAAHEHQADVIVMGATGRTGLVRVLLGSTTRRLLGQLPCSLLTVKEEDVLEELFDGEVRLIKQLMAEGQESLRSGAPTGAVARFRQVLAHNPFHAGAMAGLAEAHEKLNDPDRARYYRRRAEDLQERW